MMYAIVDLKKKNGEWDIEKILSLKDGRQDFFINEQGEQERKSLFFCGAFRAIWEEEGKKFEVGINHYKRNGVGELQIKVHGGCSQEGETPRRTLQREAKEETGRYLSPTAPVIHVHVFRYTDAEILADPSKNGMAEHIHIFFLDIVSPESKNVCFKTVTGSDESVVTKRKESSPIIWTVFNQALVNTLFHNHYPVFKKAHAYLVAKYVGPQDVDKAYALRNIRFIK